jgi:hypothetical protein
VNDTQSEHVLVARADKVDRLEAIIADLLKACKLTTNICEIVGPSPGALTGAHRLLAQEYAAKGRAAVAKAEGKEAPDAR